MASNDGPVGKLFSSYEGDGRDIEVVTLDVQFNPSLNRLHSVTFVSVDVGNANDPHITLQRFYSPATEFKNTEMELSPEEFGVLLRESSILHERRIKKNRR